VKLKIKLFVLFFAAAALSEIMADPVLSGSINTVNPRSGFNALRNPALMSSEKGDSLGLIFLYSHDIDMSVNGEVDASFLDDETISTDSDEDFNGSVFFSSVTRIGRGAFGFGIKQNSDNQFLLSSSESVIEGIIPGPLDFKSETEEEKIEAGFGLVFSYALSLKRSESVGFFIENNYYHRKISKKITIYDPAISSDRDFESERQGVSFIPGLGLHVSEGRHEAGFMLRMGEIMFEKQEYTLDDSITMFSGREKTPLFYYFNRGAEVLTGYGYRPAGELNFYAEAGFMFPFLKKEIKRNDETLQKEKSYSRLDYGYLVSCGFESVLSRGVLFNSGLMFLMIKNRAYDNNSIETGVSEYNVMQLNAGLDIRYSEEVRLLFGAGIYRFIADFTSENSLMALDLNAESTYLSLSAGITRKY